MQFQLGDGTWEGKKLLGRATLDELHRPVIIADGELGAVLADEDLPVMYALGWYVQAVGGQRWIYHGGNTDGFSSFVALLPRERDGFVILTNLTNTPAPYVLAGDLHDQLQGAAGQDWNAVFKARQDQTRKAREEYAALNKEEHKAGTHPGHPLDDYVGVYTNPAYGDLRIERQGQALAVRYNALQAPLEHWHYEVWNVREGDDEGTKVTFQTNARGEVDRLSLPLEPAVADIVFTRKAMEPVAAQLHKQ